MKLKTVYICQQCSYESQKWLGKCPSCSAWSSFNEDTIVISSKQKNTLSQTPRAFTSTPPSSISQNLISEKFSTDIAEFDRVLGGGITKGSLILLSGEPGIGKSTLTLQVAANIAKNKKVLIISGEESIEQISTRALRLKANEKNLLVANEIVIENILEIIKKEQPDFVVIDSIQVMLSMDLPAQAGSINQVRYCAEQIMQTAKSSKTAVMLIGHVTKDGTLAGPRVLEHLVDVVMQIEGDRFQQFRILRSSKNRFGACFEAGIFEMTENGLTEVKNPSEQLLEGRKENSIGSVITVAMEGTRPFLVEVQALVSTTPFGYPKRTANGFDLNRLQILIAVLEKYGKLNLQNQDVFINIVGGIKLSEPAADLAVLTAVASSYLKKPTASKAIIYGEVGLSGELRKVSFTDQRIKESKRLGFEKIISPKEFKEITELLKSL